MTKAEPIGALRCFGVLSLLLLVLTGCVPGGEEGGSSGPGASRLILRLSTAGQTASGGLGSLASAAQSRLADIASVEVEVKEGETTLDPPGTVTCLLSEPDTEQCSVTETATAFEVTITFEVDPGDGRTIIVNVFNSSGGLLFTGRKDNVNMSAGDKVEVTIPLNAVVTAAALANKTFTFDTGTPFGIPGGITLTFSVFSGSTGSFTLTSGGSTASGSVNVPNQTTSSSQSRGAAPGQSRVETPPSGCVFTVEISTFESGQGPQVGDEIVIDPCLVDPETGSLTLGTITSTPPTSPADLEVAKADSPDPVLIGQSLTYTTTVTNIGPAAATDVQLTDTLPENVTFVSATPGQGTCADPTNGIVACDLGTLAVNGVATTTLIVTPTAVGTITNTVEVMASETDPNVANNTHTQNTTVNPAPGSSASGGPISPGGALTVEVIDLNSGAPIAGATVIVDHDEDSRQTGTTNAGGVEFTIASGGPVTVTVVGPDQKADPAGSDFGIFTIIDINATNLHFALRPRGLSAFVEGTTANFKGPEGKVLASEISDQEFDDGPSPRENLDTGTVGFYKLETELPNRQFALSAFDFGASTNFTAVTGLGPLSDGQTLTQDLTFPDVLPATTTTSGTITVPDSLGSLQEVHAEGLIDLGAQGEVVVGLSAKGTTSPFEYILSTFPLSGGSSNDVAAKAEGMDGSESFSIKRGEGFGKTDVNFNLIDVPTNLSPTEVSEGVAPHFSWTGVSEASFYVVEIEDSNTDWTVMVRPSSNPGGSFTLPDLTGTAVAASGLSPGDTVGWDVTAIVVPASNPDFDFNSINQDTVRHTLTAFSESADATFTPSSNILVFGDRSSERSELAAALTELGYNVTNVATLPSDLSTFDCIWHVGAFTPLTAGEQSQLKTFLAAGGGIHLTGERPCCETLNDSLQTFVNSVVVGGGVTVGDQGDIGAPHTFNSNAAGNITTNPNTLTSWVPSASGGMIGLGDLSPAPSNILTTGVSGVASGAVWDSNDLVGNAGRLTLFMDVNWLSPIDANDRAIIENFLAFLKN